MSDTLSHKDLAYSSDLDEVFHPESTSMEKYIPVLFHAFYKPNKSNPIDFTHPHSNYGEVLSYLETEDENAIPCLRSLLGCTSKCDRKHFDFRLCETVYINHLEFRHLYEQISGIPDVIFPLKSILDQMFNFDWTSREGLDTVDVNHNMQNKMNQ